MAEFLLLVPYPIYPPCNGGALRCFNLLRQLSQHHAGQSLIYQDPAELGSLQEEIGGHTTIRSTGKGPWRSTRVAGGRLAGLRYRWLSRSPRGPAERFFLDAHPMVKELQRGGPPPHFIVFEGVGTLSLAPVLRRWARRSVFILDAHNVDHVLMRQEWDAATARGEKVSRQSGRLFAVTRRRERNLARRVDAFLACSEEDRAVLARLNPTVAGFVVPNGVDCARLSFKPVDERPLQRNVLFCGSLDYAANQDGLEWFGSQIWPSVYERFPDATLTLVGRGGSPDRFGAWLRGAGIRWAGEVEDVLPYYHDAAVAICPLRIGSGTRLKILEALSTGTPMVSTTLGAEGLLQKCAGVLTVADSAPAFADAVCTLLSDRALAGRLSRAGRELALAEYDWDVIGRALDNALDSLLDSRDNSGGVSS